MSSSSNAPETWIAAFCSLVGHEYFAEVSEDFVEDDFNLTGLASQVPMYKEALEMILDVEPEDDGSEDDEDEEEEEEDEEEEDEDLAMDGDDGARGYGSRRADAAERRHLRMASDLSVIESSAEMLYGLIHQRFITSRPGIQQMAEKYELGHFGHCPRVYCFGAKVLPVGCSDIPGQETVKLFCPSCLDVYSPPNSRFQTVDGAFFGTTFGCLFFMTFPELDVGGQTPAAATATTPADPLASPAPTSASTKDPPTGRTSLSSSLGGTSAPPTTADPHSNTSGLPPQPESINGTTPRNLAPGLGIGMIYEPRIYGFRVAETSKTGPRMKWLRSKPRDVTELDECAQWTRDQAARLGAGTAAAADLGDSEMIDEVPEGDGEVEEGEEAMELEAEDHGASGVVETKKTVGKALRKGRRKGGEVAGLNGEGGTAVSVGGGG